jgi:hypothetical protein
MCPQCLFVLGCGLRAPAGINSTSNVLVNTHFDSCLSAMSLDELAPVAYHQPHGLQVILDCQLRLTSARHMHRNQLEQSLSMRMLQGAKVGSLVHQQCNGVIFGSGHSRCNTVSRIRNHSQHSSTCTPASRRREVYIIASSSHLHIVTYGFTALEIYLCPLRTLYLLLQALVTAVAAARAGLDPKTTRPSQLNCVV